MKQKSPNPNVKINRVLASEQVANLIKELIKTEQWKVNEKIPAESELAEMYGVNRLTVRMALQKLNTLGILETRIGEGSYVKAFSFQNYINAVADFYMQPELLDNVCEFRKVVEVECARLAMERATPQELADLKGIFKLYHEGKIEFNKLHDSEDFKEVVDMDLKFHSQICKMSHNVLYMYAFSAARPSIHRYLSIIIKERTEKAAAKNKGKAVELREEDDLHYTIVEAIRNKDFETCKRAYLDMVDYSIDI